MEREESENRGDPADTDPHTAEAAWDADRALVRQALDRDPEALETLARRMLCIPRILDVLARRTGPFRDADERNEAVQEVSTRVWAALDRYQGRSGLETWIYGFCSLTLVDLRRGRGRRRLRLREVPLDAGQEVAAEPSDELAPLDAVRVQAAVRRLPDEESQVVEGRFFHGQTFEQFATHAGISPNTAKTRYYRAMDRLRRWLRPSFGETESRGPTTGSSG